jgi:NTP pyrophosphatase (non-canonical NTP hydrolase)
MSKRAKTFQEVSDAIRQHMQERGWDANPPRGIATSIVLEASELLEHYQWRDDPVGDKDALAEELADILIYSFQFSQAYGIDVAEAIERKLAKSAKKYPVDHFAGKTPEQRAQAWYQDKLNHKKAGL